MTNPDGQGARDVLRFFVVIAVATTALTSCAGSPIDRSFAPETQVTATTVTKTTLTKTGPFQSCTTGVLKDGDGDGWGDCIVEATNPLLAHTGVQTSCGPGSTLIDADSDGWGGCFLVPVLPSTTATLPTPPALDAAQLAAAIVPAAKAWLFHPSGPAYDELAAAVKGVLDSRAPLPAGGFASAADVQGFLTQLLTYPGVDWKVGSILGSLAPVLPGLPAITSNGTYTVGQNFVPGTYRTLNGVDGCYWETLNSAGDINDNNFIDSAPQVIMHVRASDFAVHIEGCGWFVRTG